MRTRLVASLTATLVLSLAAFTGTSLAGNGHGNGGPSTPPGQQPAPAPAPAPAAAPSHGNGKGASDKKSSTSPGNPATGGSNANGVKPSSTTKHDTYAKASSDKTKRYGNGQTAGQIATKKGYGDATLHGPGNSQPHKTADCRGHEVDVHALKAKGSKCAPASPAPAKPQHEQKQEQKQKHAQAAQHVTICHATGSGFVVISPSASGVYHGHLGHQDARDIVPPFTYDGQTYSQNWDAAGQAAFANGCQAPATPASSASVTPAPSASVTPAPQAPTQPAQAQVAAATHTSSPAPAAPQTATAAGAVKGAVVTLRPQHKKAAGGVLGATTRLGSAVAGRHLPFTGLPLWIFVAVAAGLILTGAAVRRSSADRI